VIQNTPAMNPVKCFRQQLRRRVVDVDGCARFTYCI
jgi:hypothetical protein